MSQAIECIQKNEGDIKLYKIDKDLASWKIGSTHGTFQFDSHPL
jgi:hypothetical protein